MNKRLLDLTNAYLALEDLQNSRLLSDDTRHILEEALRHLDEESTAEQIHAGAMTDSSSASAD